MANACRSFWRLHCKANRSSTWLRHEYKIIGKGTPLVVYSRNPDITPKEKHYPYSGIVLGLTAVKEDRPGQVPLLKLYDALARSHRSPVLLCLASHRSQLHGYFSGTLLAYSKSGQQRCCIIPSTRLPRICHRYLPDSPVRSQQDSDPVYPRPDLFSNLVAKPDQRSMLGPENSRTLPTLVFSL
jgi:hypothetical protein